MTPGVSQQCLKCYLYEPVFILQLASISQSEMDQSIQRSLLRSTQKDDLCMDLIYLLNHCI